MARVRLIRRVTSRTARYSVVPLIRKRLPGSKCTGLRPKGAPAFAFVRRSPGLNIFNNVTITRIAPSTAGVEEAEAANGGSFDHHPLAPTRQLVVHERFFIRLHCPS